MRFLFITPIVPLPPTGGGNRSFNFLKAIKLVGSVDLMCFQELSKDNLKHLNLLSHNIIHMGMQPRKKKLTFARKVLSRLCLLFPCLYSSTELVNEIDFFVNKKWKNYPVLRFFYFKYLTAALWNNLNPQPVIVNQLNIDKKWWQSKLDFLQKDKYDAIMIDFSYFGGISGILKFNNGQIFICNAHNVEHRILEQSHSRKLDFVERNWAKMQIELMKQTEKLCINLSNQVLCCSELDKSEFKKLDSNAKIEVVPNGVDIDYFKPTEQHVSNPILLFTGTMNYYPNIEAINWFILEVLPKIMLSVANVKLIVAGRDASSLLNIDKSSVILINNPEDMRPFFDLSSIVIVPLRIGSGTRLKILEAASMGKAIVTTTLGCEGLSDINSEVLITADTADEMITSILALLNDQQRRSKIGQSAQRWVSERYSWNKIQNSIAHKIQNKYE